MGKSFKKTPIKKIKGPKKDNYWGAIRSKTKNVLRSKHYSEIDDELLPDPKTIINDCDYIEQIALGDEDDPRYTRK